MVDATISNEPISIVLNDGESVNVPSGEIWKVWVNFSIFDGGNDDGGITVNGDQVTYMTTSDSGSGNHGPGVFILESGDSIGTWSSADDTNAHISGFVIN